jgi:hypothetical protein
MLLLGGLQTRIIGAFSRVSIHYLLSFARHSSRSLFDLGVREANLWDLVGFDLPRIFEPFECDCGSGNELPGLPFRSRWFPALERLWLVDPPANEAQQ